METLSRNKVPINVQHNLNNNNDNYYYTRTSRVQSPTPGLQSFQSPSGGFSDSKENIQQRMKEFEERCRRWREEFFSKNTNFQNLSTFNDFDPPPPPPPPPPQPTTSSSGFNTQSSASNLSGSAPFSNYQDSATSSSYFNTAAASSLNPQFNSPSFPRKTSPFTSSLHKSYVEDTRDGRKVYKIEFEIGDFKANELQISTQGNLLVVKGDREVKVGSTTETKTFNREITLPDYVDASNLNAYLVDNLASNLSNLTLQSTQSSQSLVANATLIVEAPVINDKYIQRRTHLNSTSSSPTTFTRNISSAQHTPLQNTSASKNNLNSNSTSYLYSPSKVIETNKTTSESRTSTTSTSHYSSSKISKSSSPVAGYSGSSSNINDYLYKREPVANTKTTSTLNTSSNAGSAPEIINGYPVYNKDENCMVYKFDLRGFDQSEIHLSITQNKALEIKASKEINDNIGKTYREFKREIQLNNSFDINKISNVLSLDGILTIKLPYANTNGVNDQNNNNISIANSNSGGLTNFSEYYSNDGKLAKLTCDFNEFEPEHLKIVLTTNNELKITAEIYDNLKPNRIVKQCFRQYNLPPYIQPESMKAIMSRDGILTIDFTGNNNKNNNNTNQQNTLKRDQHDQRIHLKA